MKPVVISAFTATTCLGVGLTPLLQGLQQQRSGLALCNFDDVDFTTWAGLVSGLDDMAWPAEWVKFDCRNNRLAWLALQADGFVQRVQAAVQRYGADRVAVLLGTSTSGIYSTEVAYRHRDPVTGALPESFDYEGTHNAFSLPDFVRHALGITGPAAGVSTACSSSAKVFASAARLLQTHQVDAVVVGGVDSACYTTIYGFKSLGLTSTQPCRPFDAQRDGLSIGEGAAFALLEQGAPQAGDLVLAGYGETSDAYHMSSPHPEGEGARTAMVQALERAGLQPDDIGYINLHGTATPGNDAAEGCAVSALFGERVPCSSTKGHMGHTLGAAGCVEACVSLLALQHGLVPAGVGTQTLDPSIAPVQYVVQNRAQPQLQAVLSNSFGFGGSNCSLVFRKIGATA